MMVVSGMLLAGVVAFGLVFSSGGVEGAQERSVRSFERLEFADSGVLVLTQGDEYRVRIEGPANVAERVHTEVISGTLRIYRTDWVSLGGRSPLRFLVTAPNVTHLNTTGSGTIETESLSASQITFATSGSGSIDIGRVDAEVVQISSTGPGGIDVEAGTADRLVVSTSGSGDVDAAGIAASDATVTLSGSGDAEVSVTGRLQATLSSSGNLTYSGDPVLDLQTTSSGRARQARPR